MKLRKRLAIELLIQIIDLLITIFLKKVYEINYFICIEETIKCDHAYFFDEIKKDIYKNSKILISFHENLYIQLMIF